MAISDESNQPPSFWFQVYCWRTIGNTWLSTGLLFPSAILNSSLQILFNFSQSPCFRGWVQINECPISSKRRAFSCPLSGEGFNQTNFDWSRFCRKRISLLNSASKLLENLKVCRCPFFWSRRVLWTLNGAIPMQYFSLNYYTIRLVVQIVDVSNPVQFCRRTWQKEERWNIKLWNGFFYHIKSI